MCVCVSVCVCVCVCVCAACMSACVRAFIIGGCRCCLEDDKIDLGLLIISNGGTSFSFTERTLRRIRVKSVYCNGVFSVVNHTKLPATFLFSWV